MAGRGGPSSVFRRAEDHDRGVELSDILLEVGQQLARPAARLDPRRDARARPSDQSETPLAAAEQPVLVEFRIPSSWRCERPFGHVSPTGGSPVPRFAANGRVIWTRRTASGSSAVRLG
jgi:hypothetical protein